ncbi:3-keto-5-aminohexanoate cleavage protein [Candidatus Formimonas warabiya]|uniref:3-keto-5-aminohexanoate cleavage protein n=1 Tax=Formimonas warabiya TaxID=1761012 RepID=A0A3G1KXI2_FORW1|nr:3-keto-5-aminohexanoate cleavage protein [Candidatus Formimonas warabiya]ATW26915.1 3-keto-5-aminohexanoate cleavage protein [Candidatus Formimonas warabiya]
MDKLIITVAAVGAEVTKKDNPNLPVTPLEIAEEAQRCAEKGASIIHLHVRDGDGNPTQSKEVFAETIRLIKERTNIIIQTSTGGAAWMSGEERLQPIELKPEMATLTTGTVNFGAELFSNPTPMVEQFAKKIVENGVKPEIEVFEVGMINNALNLVKKGILQLPLHFDFVMGVPGGIPGEPRHLLHLVESLPAGCTWTVAGIGRYELSLGTLAILLGGNVRVGFEDNIFYAKGVLAQSNGQLVERMARLAKELGREVATPDEARKILHLI